MNDDPSESIKGGNARGIIDAVCGSGCVAFRDDVFISWRSCLAYLPQFICNFPISRYSPSPHRFPIAEFQIQFIKDEASAACTFFGFGLRTCLFRSLSRISSCRNSDSVRRADFKLVQNHPGDLNEPLESKISYGV